MRLSRLGRGWVYSFVTALLVTGVVWFVLDRWFPVAGEFGAEKHPLQGWLLRLHGLAAMGFLVIVGWLLPLHVRGGWRAGLNRRSGTANLLWNGGLAFTGYALYYVGEESWRSAISWLHLALGVLLPAVVVVHVLRGRRVRRQRPPTDSRPAR